MSTHHPSIGSTRIGNVIKSISKTFGSGSKRSNVQIKATVFGGAENQDVLLQQLKIGTLPSRANAASKIIDSLRVYSISSIPEIWYLARDMSRNTVQRYIRRIALNLLKECVSLSEESVGNRQMFLSDIISNCHISRTRVDQDFDLFLEAITVLTSNGRNIDDLCMRQQEGNLLHFLERCITTLGGSSKYYIARESDGSSPGKSHTEITAMFLNFLKNCMSHNYFFIGEKYVEIFTINVLRIGQYTNSSTILRCCMDYIDVALTLDFIPSQCYFQLSFLLACVSKTQDSDIVHINALLKKLCQESNIQLTIDALGKVITSSEAIIGANGSGNALVVPDTVNTTLDVNDASMKFQASLGGIFLLKKVWFVVSMENRSDQDIYCHLMFRIAHNALSYNVPQINSTFLKCFDDLLSAEDTILSNQKVELSSLIPFQMWYSSTYSFFDILAHLKLQSLEDYEIWGKICSKLIKSYENHEIIYPKEKLVSVLMKKKAHLSSEHVEFILEYYREQKLCSMLSPLWKENWILLLNSFFYLIKKEKGTSPCFVPGSKVRLLVLRTLKEGLEDSISIYGIEYVSFEVVIELIRKLAHEEDRVVLSYLMNNFIAYNARRAPTSFFKSLSSIIKYGGGNKGHQDSIRSLISIGSFSSQNSNSVESQQYSSAYLELLSEGLVKSLVTVASIDGHKASELFNFLARICSFALTIENVNVLLIISRCFVRIRSTSEGWIYFSKPKDMDGLSTNFGRNTYNSAFVHACDHKWEYPESLPYLPEEFFDNPNKNLTLFDFKSSRLILDKFSSKIDISKWISIVLEIMQKFVDWEIYSFIWAHFCSQLSNLDLFIYNKEQIIKLRGILCDHLMLNLPPSLALPESTTKANLQVASLRTLSALMGYHNFFKKQEQDNIVSALLFGLGSWDKTAIPAINILTICCYEIPLSIKKYLSAILIALQTKVTSASVSLHTLEFLFSLINLPTLTSNFTPEENNRVFATAFKFIQHSKDSKKISSLRSEPASSINVNVSRAIQVDETPTDTNVSMTPLLWEYVLNTSYLIICMWFMHISISEKRRVSAYLIRNLLSLSDDAEQPDDHTLSYIDLISRFTYSDLPLKMGNPNGIKNNLLDEDDDQERTLSSASWIIGYSILSIYTHKFNGKSVVTIRRPTGISILKIDINEAQITPYLNTKGSNGKQPIINSGYLFLQLFNTLDIKNKSKPLPLIEDTATTRAISTFDRLPVVDFHKVGIVYIGPNQTSEVDILQNQIGSDSYNNFVDSIGRYMKLKNCKDIYVGGLDTESDIDGEYALFWHNDISQIIFHTATLMPNSDKDLYCDLKKRHIGNNYVTIFFDESGRQFNFNTIKSQFNFLSIVISPHTHCSSTIAKLDPSPQISNEYVSYSTINPSTGSVMRFFKVKTYRMAGVPGIASTNHFKIVSEEHLPSFIRNLTILVDRFAAIWHLSVNSSYTTNWAHRVKQIRALKEKTIAMHEKLETEATNKDIGLTEQTYNNTAQSFLDQLRDPSSTNFGSEALDTYDNMPQFQYLSEEESKVFAALEFNSYTY